MNPHNQCAPSPARRAASAPGSASAPSGATATLQRKENELEMFSVNLDGVQTNMVYIKVLGETNAEKVVEKLSEHDIHVLALGDDLLRAVTHIHITDEDIENSIDVFKLISS